MPNVSAPSNLIHLDIFGGIYCIIISMYWLGKNYVCVLPQANNGIPTPFFSFKMLHYGRSKNIILRTCQE